LTKAVIVTLSAASASSAATTHTHTHTHTLRGFGGHRFRNVGDVVTVVTVVGAVTIFSEKPLSVFIISQTQRPLPALEPPSGHTFVLFLSFMKCLCIRRDSRCEKSIVICTFGRVRDLRFDSRCGNRRVLVNERRLRIPRLIYYCQIIGCRSQGTQISI